ncbi:hypothetical protein [Aliarcobacter butzleri]|uniref:hypothetical protein n=1 Tax=Aliarcobacter butzleri TaxID=28197 RepID=UPI002B246D97|nr:hypothetical protein [Aliarcobacter butzleri]
MNFESLFDKLLNFYGVKNLKGLSEVTGIPISTISSIKQRESITALKKKCRELGIYNEIFGDLNSNITPVIKNEIKINDILLKQAKNEASKFGLDINSYIEHLIIQDLKESK